MMTRQSGSMLAVALLVGGMLTLGGCGGEVVVPTEYEPYNAKDASFSCEAPAGWTIEGGGKGHQWAKFTSGSAKIRIHTGIVGSLIADMPPGMNLLGDAEGIDEEDLAPVAHAHAFEKDIFAQDYSDYEEQPAVAIQTGLGDSRQGEFTAAGSFGGTTHGYRVTALTLDKRIRIVCECPESDWEALRPAFDHVIKSLAPGKRER